MVFEIDYDLDHINFINLRDEYDTLMGFWVDFSDYFGWEKLDVLGMSVYCIKTQRENLYIVDDSEAYRALKQRIAEEPKEFALLLEENELKYGLLHGALAAILVDVFKEFHLDKYDACERYDLSVSSDYLSVERLVQVVESFEIISIQLEGIRPENVVETKAIKIVDRYKTIYGENFEKIGKVDDKTLCTRYIDAFESIGAATYKFMDEQDFFRNAVEGKRYKDPLWIRRMQELYQRFTPIMIEICKNAYGKYLNDKYRNLDEMKQRLVSTIDGMIYNDALDVKEQLAESEELLQEEKNEGCVPEFANDLWEEYVKFFRLAQVFVDNYMNEISRDKTKRNGISQSSINEAMMFFYDASDVTDAEEKREKIKYQSNKRAGDEGERKVNEALRWLDKEYVVIDYQSKDRYGNSCILLLGEGQPTPQEFDHIVISAKGVFLIETKNYSGKIIIDKEGNWQREIDGTLKGEKNPLMQIRRHEKVVKSFLPSEMPVYSILCIANDSAIIEGTANTELLVIKYDLLVELIEKFEGRTVPQDLVDNTVDLIYKHMIDAEKIGEKLN